MSQLPNWAGRAGRLPSLGPGVGGTWMYCVMGSQVDRFWASHGKGRVGAAGPQAGVKQLEVGGADC